jgi:SAM-dependent methyltransferase
MQESKETPAFVTAPSLWVRRFLPLIRPGGLVLDLAAGGGRHSRLSLGHGFAVCAVDREVAALLPLAGPRCEARQVDLETGGGWPLGGGFDGIVVTNYLYRPLLPALGPALAPGGILIYETFALGNERFGRPRNPDFLLRPGELLQAFATLTVIAFEQGEVSAPQPAVVQRLAAVAGPPGRLPEAAGSSGDAIPVDQAANCG